MSRTGLAVALMLSLAAPAFAEGSGSSSSGSHVDNGLNPELRAPGGLMDGSPKTRPSMLSFFLEMPHWYWGWYSGGIGLGGRYTLPLLHQGFLPGVNDSLSLDVGADITFLSNASFASVLDFPVELMWTLHFVPQVAAYLKLGLALEMVFASQVCWSPAVKCSSGGFGLGPVGAAGLLLKLTPSLYLRVEAGYPWFKVGLGFPF